MAQPPLPLEEATRRIAAIDRAIAAGYPTLQAACDAASELLGISRITLRSCLPGIKQKYGMEPQPITKPSLGPKQAPALSFPVFPSDEIPTDHILDHLERQYAQAAVASAARKWFTVGVNENLPIAINWFGDPHIGSPGCNIPLLRRDVQIVRDTPGMYGGNAGDSVDNWGGRLIRLYADTDVSKKTERQLARWFLQESGVRWAIWLHGNHDSMSSEFIVYMNEIGAKQVPMIDWRAQFKIAFPNGEEFKIDAAHDHKGSSIWNDLHGQERAASLEEEADLYISGHRHNWAYKVKEMVGGRIVSLVRCRGYKFIDDYAVRWQFPQQQQGASMTTIFDPLTDSPTERLRVFADTRAAADYLTYLRARYSPAKQAKQKTKLRRA